MTTEFPEEVARRLAEIVDGELIGGQTPSISLQPWDLIRAVEQGEGRPSEGLMALRADSKNLSDPGMLAAYLNELLASRGSGLRVEEVDAWYFEPGVRPITVAHLGLVDSEAGTRRLFVMGPHSPAIVWVAEELSGPVLESRRLVSEGPARWRKLQAEALSAVEAYLTPFAARLEAYVAGLDLVEAQLQDIESVTEYGSYDTMELKDLAFICGVIGLSLERLFSNEFLA